jgi:hypothetical protein
MYFERFFACGEGRIEQAQSFPPREASQQCTRRAAYKPTVLVA